MPTRFVRLLVLHFGLLAAAFLLTACGTPPLATPPPTPQAVFLAYPPDLRPYADDLAACARQYPDIALFLTETVEEPTPDGQTSLFLAAGVTPAALVDWNATLLAEDTLAVIVNSQNTLETLTIQELRAVWSGELLTWAELGGSDGEIQVWAYPAGSRLRTMFDSTVMSGELTSSRSWLAPDPQAALEVVAAEPNAISYLPASWLESALPEQAGSVRALSLPEALNVNLHQPVLALTEAEPQGALRTLLLCFQSGQ
jgi:hypothetical protein